MGAAVSATAAKVAATHPDDAVIRSYIAAAAITAGQAVYLNTAGKVDLAQANSSGKEQFRGIALESVGAGQAVSVLVEGSLAGFDLSGVAYDGLVYLADTAGGLYDTASSSKTVQVGRVVPVSDNALTKILYVRSDMIRNW